MPFYLSFAYELVVIAAVLLSGWFMEKAAAFLLKPKKGLWFFIVRFVFFTATVRLPCWIGDENALFVFLFYVGIFLWCYGGPVLSKLVVSITLYLLIIPINMIIDTALRIPMEYVFEDIAGSLLKLMVSFLLCLFLRRLSGSGKRPELPNRLWGLCGFLAVAPLFTALSFPFWNGFSHKVIDESQLRLAYTVLPFIILSACALIAAMFVLSRQAELEEEHRLSGMREMYYDSLRQQQEQLRTLRHDLRNHLAAVSGMLSEGDTLRAQEYLAELGDSPALHGARQLCENEIANIVLSGKLEIIEQRGLEPDFLVTLPAELPIADADMCSLIGNALDNAITAAEAAEDKRISLRMRADHGMLMLRTENACPPELSAENGRFETTKEDKSAHGFGISGMAEISSRYGGTLEATAKNGRFELVACLPLQSV